MSPHLRALAFCAALLVAPFLSELGDALAGMAGGVGLPAVFVAGVALWAARGSSGDPGTPAPPAAPVP